MSRTHAQGQIQCRHRESLTKSVIVAPKPGHSASVMEEYIRTAVSSHSRRPLRSSCFRYMPSICESLDQHAYPLGPLMKLTLWKYFCVSIGPFIVAESESTDYRVSPD